MLGELVVGGVAGGTGVTGRPQHLHREERRCNQTCLWLWHPSCVHNLAKPRRGQPVGPALCAHNTALLDVTSRTVTDRKTWLVSNEVRLEVAKAEPVRRLAVGIKVGEGFVDKVLDSAGPSDGTSMSPSRVTSYSPTAPA